MGENQKYALSVDERSIKLVKEPNDVVKPNLQMIYASVALKLENKTADTLTYTNMSCSWYEIYTINNKKVNILSWLCFSNYPIQCSVAPRSLSSSTLIVYYKKSDGKQKFKIGITLHATENDLMGMNNGKLFANPKNLLWSNEVTTP